MGNPESKDTFLNPESSKKAWRSLFSSLSNTLLFSGSIILGFIIAWRHGGFPSILLLSFIGLALDLPEDIYYIIRKSSPKYNIEALKGLRGFVFVITAYLIVAWLSGALLPLLESPRLNNVLRKVEFPFSEARHVVVDSRDSVYVYSQFNHRIQKYSKEGRFQFGWFASNCNEMAIDENDFIYTYRDSIIRKYDNNGNLIDEMSRERTGSGWWRFMEDSVIWDPDAEAPRRYDPYDTAVKESDVYNTAVKEPELMPAYESRKSGFKTKAATYYKLTKLWSLFPVVSVEGQLSKVETHIMPNPLSSAFTFVFPGFLFYILALFVDYVIDIFR